MSNHPKNLSKKKPLKSIID